MEKSAKQEKSKKGAERKKLITTKGINQSVCSCPNCCKAK